MTLNGKKHDDHAELSPVVHTSPTIPELPQIISLPHLLRQPLVEPRWVVPGLLPVGVSLLAGPARVDKALLANQLGLSVAAGQPFLQRFPVHQGQVLYLALAESSVHVRGRAMSLLNQQNSPDAFHVAFRWSPFRQGGLADLEDSLAGLQNSRLVIIDPVEFVQPLRSDTGNYGYKYRQGPAPETALTFFVPLRELAARYNLAILLLHHLPDDWPTNRRDPLAGLSPTGLTTASACNLLLNARHDAHTCELHIAGGQVAELRLRLSYDSTHGEWREEQ